MNSSDMELYDDVGRIDLAKRLASGLVGWLHCMAARNVGYLADEDAARVELCQILNGQRKNIMPRKNVVPTDWKAGDRYLDVGIGEVDHLDHVVHGAIELKWSSTTPIENVRRDIVQDIIRLASVHPTRPVVRFMLLGGGLNLDKLFSQEHKKHELLVQRDFICDLMAQSLSEPSRQVPIEELSLAFKDCFDRLPSDVNRNYSAIRTELLGKMEIYREWSVPGHVDKTLRESWGQVMVWQIDPTA